MHRLLTRLFTLGLLITALSFNAAAQCAMCAATVESNGKAEANSVANGINTGILYLMILPYLMFGTIAYFWYKNAKKRTAKIPKPKPLAS